MSTRGVHKTVQPRILVYAEAKGWIVLAPAQGDHRESDVDLFDGNKVERISLRIEGNIELCSPLDPRAVCSGTNDVRYTPTHPRLRHLAPFPQGAHPNRTDYGRPRSQA
jgi:hypothetical protein